MKLSIYLLLTFLSLALAIPQFDFINNLFRGNRGRPQRGRGQRLRSQGGGGGNSGRGCGGGHSTNYNYDGHGYLVSWKVGCNKMTNREAENFCRAKGLQPISIDSQGKEREFLNLVQRDRQKYFWTGGKVRGRTISWPSGRNYNNVNWSNTGGANRRQPDNREGNEFCLAVLNNFYNDGVRFHDVACHHKKPVICQ